MPNINVSVNPSGLSLFLSIFLFGLGVWDSEIFYLCTAIYWAVIAIYLRIAELEKEED